MDFYQKSAKEVLEDFSSSPVKGLSQREVSSRLERYGANELKKEKPSSPVKIFLRQFMDPMVMILILAVIISFFIGESKDAIVIIAILILNAILGFIQEYKAERAIDALKKLAGLKATVIRDGKEQKIESSLLVPGDIILLESGTKIAADARLVESFSLYTLESALTGESAAVEKNIQPIKKEIALADRSNSVYSGTIVTRGRAKAVVTSTGMSTELGKIAALIQEQKTPPTPLELRLKQFSKVLGLIILCIVAVVLLFRVMSGISFIAAFRDSVALAVAAIPEGLPIVFTMCLALGIGRMIKRNALIRNLHSVETLGSVTVICSDKTGTLTYNRMDVRKIYVDNKVIDVTGEGYNAKGEFISQGKRITPSSEKSLMLMLRIGALNNDAKIVDGDVVGDPTEGALLASAMKARLFKEELEVDYPRVDEIGFTSERKMMSTVHSVKGKRFIYVKGSPQIVVGKCTKVLVGGKEALFTNEHKKRMIAMDDAFCDDTLRVLAFAYKPLGSGKASEDSLVFVGLQAMMDPPREEARDAIRKCHESGIRVVMITGDHKNTAMAVAKALGIKGMAVDGAELDRIQDLSKEVESISIFARVNPEHKLKIVEALKRNGHIVAMTGDGVNDAPALKDADIGIAMGITGTDVAKEASGMILTDDNFVSIVSAVEEGRVIYDNIKKSIVYLLSSNFGEILTILAAVIIGLPLPLLALQILWLNLLTDGFPALALSVDPKESDIMSRKPRDPKEPLTPPYTFFRMIYIGLVMMIGTLALFWLANKNSGYVYATTVAFTALMVFEMFNVLNCRSETASVFGKSILSNIYLIAAILVSIGLQLVVIYTPLNAWFRTTPLAFIDWIIIIAVASSVLWANEFDKLVQRWLKSRKSQA